MVMTRFLNTILGVKCFFCDHGDVTMVQNNVKCVQKKRGIKIIYYLRQHENNKPFEKSAQMTWKSSSITRFTNFRRISEGPFMALICTIKEENYMQFEFPSHLMKPIEIPSHHMKEMTFRMDHTLWEHRLQIMHPPLFNPAFKLDKVDIHSWFRVFLVFAVFATILPIFNWRYSSAFFLLATIYLCLRLGSKSFAHLLLEPFACIWTFFYKVASLYWIQNKLFNVNPYFIQWASRAASLLQVVDAVSCQIKDTGHRTLHIPDLRINHVLLTVNRSWQTAYKKKPNNQTHTTRTLKQ